MPLNKKTLKAYNAQKLANRRSSKHDAKKLKIDNQKIVLRGAIGLIVILVTFYILGTWYRQQPFVIFASSIGRVPHRQHTVNCSADYKEDFKRFPGCIPSVCGRVVTDDLITEEEIDMLLSIAKMGLSLGEPSGGAAILDLHSGALSHERTFINLYQRMKMKGLKFSEEQLKVYSQVRQKVQLAVAEAFNIDANELMLTKPTFFSRLTAADAVTPHDEYWHAHIDKEQYGSFAYTALVYLNTYKEDFSGGRFVFIDKPKNTTVEPRKGRVSFFTSGSENTHYVERVSDGTRYALTIAFTCDPQDSITDPKMK